MSGARLPSRLIVDALIRAAQAAGGHATVLARGDDGAGTVLIECAEKGRPGPLLERILGLDGRYGWVRCGPQDIENRHEITEYLARRRGRDPDLWLIELDIVEAERFAAETIVHG
ncbi:DUF1491 family protein [Sphingomonas flavalba]|uniref:DUF1491 family protein n=1 Tax=Sphingomonas flavalba TaxID=2559804 RepID=UPI001EEFDD3F|nr:DUF1491 family protein [Sphingomonas flavalba]